MKKNVYLVMCMMLVLTFTLSAQQPRMNKARTPQNSERKMDRRHGGMVTPQMRADKMATLLELSNAEKLKLKELFEKEDANKVKRMDEIQKMKKEMKAKVANEMKAQDAELEKIIGKEKFQKLVEKRAEMKKRAENSEKSPGQRQPNSNRRHDQGMQM